MARGEFGWADYADSTHVDFATGQVCPANNWTALLNDGVNGPKTYEPSGIDLFQVGTTRGDVITGRNGDAILVTTSFEIDRPNGGNEYTLQTAYDIGGAVGDLYTRNFRVPSSSGIRLITITTAMYTLDTWETNGAIFEINPSTSVRVFNLRHVIVRAAPISNASGLIT